MELIDRNKIEFSPIQVYDFDEHKHKIDGIYIDRADVLEILDKLIEREGK